MILDPQHERFAARLLDALGIDTKDVRVAVLRVEADQPVTVTIERYVTREQGERLLDAIERKA